MLQLKTTTTRLMAWSEMDRDPPPQTQGRVYLKAWTEVDKIFLGVTRCRKPA